MPPTIQLLKSLKRKRRAVHGPPNDVVINSSSQLQFLDTQHLLEPLLSASSGRGPTAALNLTKLALSLTERFAEAIPIAGPPIKAAIGGVLEILELFDVRGKNKKQASRLVRKLRDLEKRMEWADLKKGCDEMKPHLKELTQQLESLRKILKETYDNSTSIMNSSSIADDLRDCEDSIDDFLSNYNFSATMHIENAISELLAKVDVSALSGGLLWKKLQDESIHSPIKSSLGFIDPRGKHVFVPLTSCVSFQDFERYLAFYFRVESSSPILGGKYVQKGQYALTFKNEDISLKNSRLWSKIVDTRGPVEMSIVLRTHPYPAHTRRTTGTLLCFRCSAPMPSSNETGDANFTCWHCDLDLHSKNKFRALASAQDRRIDHTSEELNYFSRFRVVQVVSLKPGCATCSDLNLKCTWNTAFDLKCVTCKESGRLCKSEFVTDHRASTNPDGTTIREESRNPFNHDTNEPTVRKEATCWPPQCTDEQWGLSQRFYDEDECWPGDVGLYTF